MGPLSVPRHPPNEELSAAASGLNPSNALDILNGDKLIFLSGGSTHV